MSENKDVQAIQTISTAVDESQMKIVLFNQCIKAQGFLFAKLKKQLEHQKETCNYISNSNFKLKSEIEIAEQEIKSLNLAIEIIKYGHTELKKEYLLIKEKRAEYLGRMSSGKKKYENLWLTAKKNYEKIPSVQQLIQVENKTKMLQANIDTFINESKVLINEIKIKNNEIAHIDRTRIIELAEFVVNERPNTLISIHEKNIKIKEISQEIDTLLKEKQECSYNSKLCNEKSLSTINNIQTAAVETIQMEVDSSENFKKDEFQIPTLHLVNNDLDVLRSKLDEIKKVNLQNIPIKRTRSIDIEINFNKKNKTQENLVSSYISPYFNNTNMKSANEKKIEISACSDKKLINILDDIRIDDDDTYKLIKKLEPNQFVVTNYIGSKCVEQSNQFTKSQEKHNSVEIEEIEEIDLKVKKNDDGVVSPPSQFLDITQKTIKKNVAFDIPTEENNISFEEVFNNSQERESKKSQEKILNVTTSEESYTKMKEIILKKHKLDLSPQFVYGKNTQMKMQHENKIIASSFFKNKDVCFEKEDNTADMVVEQDGTENIDEAKECIEFEENAKSKHSSPKIVDMELTAAEIEVPVAGIIFNHGPQGIPDSLNVSISTTGLDESEDFPHCIDSSILLSPTADLPTTAAKTGNNEVLSQEVPNFLAGFRKTGLSFFGGNSEATPDSSAQKQTGFNFNFNKDEKKGRGGLFNMFR